MIKCRMCKPDVEIWKPDCLLEFKVISADQEKCLYQFYRQCPTSPNKGTLFNMSPLFSYFPKSFDFSVFSCLCLGDFWKTSALPQHCQNHCTLLFDFCHFNLVYPFTSVVKHFQDFDHQSSRDNSPTSKLPVSWQFLYYLGSQNHSTRIYSSR